MKVMKKLIGLFLVAMFCLGLGSLSFGATKKVAPKYLFDLTNIQIKEALNFAKKGIDATINLQNQKYKVAATNNIGHEADFVLSKVNIETPYFSIVSNASFNYSKYEDFTFEDAKALLNDFKKNNQIDFSIDIFGTSIYFDKFVKVVITQDNKIIKPFKTEGLNDGLPADITDTFPDFPAYKKWIYVEFKLDKINVNKPIKLIVVHAGDIKTEYEINLKKYK